MDSEQERLQSLGFCGIFKESFKIIFTNRKIVGKISLAIIIPLTVVFLVVVPTSSVNLLMILTDQESLKDFQKGTDKYLEISRSIKFEAARFAAHTIALFTFYLFASALSTCAVVYATAYIYRSKEEISLKKIMGFFGKIWKRLIITFLFYFTIIFVISVVAELLFFVVFGKLDVPVASLVLGLILVIAYLLIMVYIGLLGQFACVVSVLEALYGYKAMIQAKALIKGKKAAAVFIFIVSSVLLSCSLGFLGTVLLPNLVLPVRIGLGILAFALLVFVNLLGLVLPTVLYFVCKAYHREAVTIEDQ